MKRTILGLATLAVLALAVAPAYAQSAAAAAASPAAAAAAPAAAAPAAAPEAAAGGDTITGRITKVDLKGGTFAVKDATTGKSVTLNKGSLDLKKFRRGSRVTVAYGADNTATDIKANRAAK